LEQNADGTCIGRTNIANAIIFGLREDLGIAPGSTQYNIALTIFFVPYILFEIPSNIILKKLKPHVWCKFRSMFPSAKRELSRTKLPLANIACC
jgi:hypothetical protein